MPLIVFCINIDMYISTYISIQKYSISICHCWVVPAQLLSLSLHIQETIDMHMTCPACANGHQAQAFSSSGLVFYMYVWMYVHIKQIYKLYFHNDGNKNTYDTFVYPLNFLCVYIHINICAYIYYQFRRVKIMSKAINRLKVYFYIFSVEIKTELNSSRCTKNVY